MAKRTFTKLRQFARRHFGVAPYASVQPVLEAWLASSFGKALLADEKIYMDRALADLFGYHLLELSIDPQTALSAASRVQHRFSLSPNAKPRADHAKVECQARSHIDSLPLESESIDVAVLHHVLEFSQNPHQQLREVARVLIPRGHILIVGFNPMSFFGIRKFIGRYLGRAAQWRHHALTQGRVIDWLQLLDFDVVSVEQGFHRPPIQHPKLLSSLSWLDRLAKKLRLPGGSYFVILACKDVVATTPLKPDWQRNFNPIAGLSVRKPAARIRDVLRQDDNHKTQRQ